MNESFLAEMRAALTALKDELQSVSEIANTSAATVELDQQRVGRLSRMDAMQAQAMAKASGRRREVMLRSIAAAQARLASGEFGCCLSCDSSINQNRLRFDPTATLCIDCANAAEKA